MCLTYCCYHYHCSIFKVINTGFKSRMHYRIPVYPTFSLDLSSLHPNGALVDIRTKNLDTHR